MTVPMHIIRRVRAISAMVLLLICFISSELSAATVGRIKIEGLHSLDREEMLDMLGLREGMPVDAGRVRSGIKRAFLKGVFDDISVDSSDGDPADITVTVTEKDMIRKIAVQGNYPVSARRIRELLTLKEDSVLRRDLIPAASEDLRSQLAQLGYTQASVTVSALSSEKHHHNITLTVSIDAGTPLYIREIRLTGKSGISLSDLKISAGDVYDQIRINKELQRIRERLKKDGYFRPVVGPYLYSDGILSLTVSPGEKLVHTIDGNSSISSKRLEKEMPFFDSENFNDESVDEAVSRMVSLYHAEGYPMVQIAPVVRKEDQQINITFFIYEGKKIKVRSIRFKGASFSDAILKTVLELKEGKPYNPDLSMRDRDTLREYYTALGYLDISIGEFEQALDSSSDSVDISVSVSEGRQTTFGTFEIKGATEERKQALHDLVMLKPEQPYNDLALADARLRMLDYYVKEGYSNADISIERTISDYRAAVTFIVSENIKKTIGRIVIAGNESTKYRVIRREMAAKEGSPYSFAAVSRERQRLYRLGLFSDVEIESFDAEGDSRDLLVRVKEGNAGSFEFGVGFAEYEQFRGFFEVAYKNLWGMNRQALFRTELSSLEKRFIIQYREPWFLGNDLPLRVMFLHETKKEITIPGRILRYQLQRNTLSAGFEKKLSETVKGELYYDFSLVKTTEIQPDVILSREDVGTLAISSVRASLFYDTRDNPFEPKKGIFAGATLKVASPLLFSETFFSKMTLFANYYHQLHNRIVFAASAKGGLAQGFGTTKELPIVERYFLGGRSSVRGYEQDMLGPKGSDGNPTGGNAFVMGSIEFRTYVGRNISLVPFVDFGNVWIKSADVSFSGLKYTTGIGFRYATPVGPLRVDYGIKLNRQPGETGGELHFSIGHAF